MSRLPFACLILLCFAKRFYLLDCARAMPPTAPRVGEHQSRYLSFHFRSSFDALFLVPFVSKSSQTGSAEEMDGRSAVS